MENVLLKVFCKIDFITGRRDLINTSEMWQYKSGKTDIFETDTCKQWIQKSHKNPIN